MPLISDPPPIEKKTTQHKKNMVSPPQPTEKLKKNGVPPSQVDLNGTALSIFNFVWKLDIYLNSYGEKSILYSVKHFLEKKAL